MSFNKRDTPRTPLVERLLRRVEIASTGCWEWTGRIHPSTGYGYLDILQVPRRAHRLMYEELVGPIPNGLDLDHLCRVRCCVNPDHLEPVTRGENTRRGLAGAQTAKRMAAISHCPQGHPYDETNTYVGVQKSGHVNRRCRACHRESQRRYMESRRVP